jgi:glycine oxidase
LSKLLGLQAAVVGAGVSGLCTALALRRAGARVTVYTAEPAAETASGVAAGMLAPAMECALEQGDGAGFGILRAGRDRWLEIAPSLGAPIELNRAGALWVGLDGDEPVLEGIGERLRAAGAAAERVDAARAAAIVPGLAAEIVGGVFTPEDWTLSPRRVLDAICGALRAEGGELVSAQVSPGAGLRLEAGREAIRADVVVLAPGAGTGRLEALAPELKHIVPVKGQLLAFAGGPMSGVTLRTAGVYIAPQAEGAVAGATMEFGAADRRLDGAALSTLRREAARLLPHLQTAPADGRAGVRATTPDGWPLIGRSRRPGVWLAAGMRRNGWLLAPLAADLLVAQLSGEGGARWSERFDPSRFEPLEAA